MHAPLVARRAAAGGAAAPLRSHAALRRPATVAASAAKMTLYGNPGSRSRIVEWYAEELGLGPDALEIKNLDMKVKREHKDPEYVSKIHAFGQVPALTVADKAGPDGRSPFALMESGAQCSYLADIAGKLPTPEARAIAAQWTLFANSTLAQALFFDGPREKALPGILASLDAFLAEKGPYLTGAEFTVSDVAVGAYLHYADRFFGDRIDVKPYKSLSAYKERVLSRPAAKKTILA